LRSSYIILATVLLTVLGVVLASGQAFWTEDWGSGQGNGLSLFIVEETAVEEEAVTDRPLLVLVEKPKEENAGEPAAMVITDDPPPVQSADTDSDDGPETDHVFDAPAPVNPGLPGIVLSSSRMGPSTIYELLGVDGVKRTVIVSPPKAGIDAAPSAKPTFKGRNPCGRKRRRHHRHWKKHKFRHGHWKKHKFHP
jgi:hypothetical protein